MIFPRLERITSLRSTRLGKYAENMKDKNGRMKQKTGKVKSYRKKKVLNKKKNDQKKNSRSPVYYSLYGATRVLLQKWGYLVQDSPTESILPRESFRFRHVLLLDWLFYQN